jgi:hypothetical protein
MRKLILAASVNLLLFCSSCHAQAVTRVDRWQEDFSVLDSQFVHRQIDPFGRLRREQWQQGIMRLRQLPIGTMTDAAVGEEIEHLLAQYHDGHIKILPDGSIAEPDYLPAKFRWFPSGIFITGAVDPKLRGAKVIRLGHANADSLLERIAPWVSIENDSGLHFAVSNALWNAAILSAAKIADTTGPVPLTVKVISGQEITVFLTPQPIADMHWVAPSYVPEYRQALTPSNWLKVMPDRHAVYLRYAECHDKGRSRSLARQLQDAPLDGAWRIIIDMRGNEGGDSAAFAPLLDTLKSRPDRSRILVLVDRGTFSSAFRNAVELKHIGATWIGEAPSQRPIYTGDVESFLLPHSHLQIRYTTKWSRLGPADLTELKPDVLIQPTAEEYFGGKDPVLDYALQTLL